MPRSTPYYVEDRAQRLARTPYDHEGPQDEGDEDTNDPYDLHELGLNLDEEREQQSEHIFNPTGARNNCANLAMAYVSGLPVSEIDDLVGPGPDEDEEGISYDELQKRADELDIELSGSPPEAYFMEGAREAAVAYEQEDGNFHFVAIDGGDDERNFTYSDHQVFDEEDVTDDVRAAPARRLCMTRRQFDDPEDDSDSSYEEDV